MRSNCIFTFWKRLEHQFLGFTVSIATLNYMQNTQMQDLVISFIVNFSLFTVFLKKRNIISKIKFSKVTDYAALIDA